MATRRIDAGTNEMPRPAATRLRVDGRRGASWARLPRTSASKGRLARGSSHTDRNSRTSRSPAPVVPASKTAGTSRRGSTGMSRAARNRSSLLEK